MILIFAQLRLLLGTGVAVILLLSGCVTTGIPSLALDGYKDLPGSAFDGFYQRAGADLSAYNNVAISGCDVTFKNDWRRDQNRRVRMTSRRIKAETEQSMRETLARMCWAAFDTALRETSAFTVVPIEEATHMTTVLLPRIMDVDVSAPDTQGSSMSRTFTTNESSEMVLSLDVMDGGTGVVLYRIVDRRRLNQSSQMQWANRVTNAVNARRIFRLWAANLCKALDGTLGIRFNQSEGYARVATK